jgi:hypothetical protein
MFDLGRVPATLDELMLERLDGRGDLLAIGNPHDSKGAARESPWGAQRPYVDDAHWHETLTALPRDADRIVCVSMRVMECGGRSHTCCKAVTPIRRCSSSIPPSTPGLAHRS